MPPVTRVALQAAYIRRKRWEARLLATEVWRALSEAMGPGDSRARAGGGGRECNHISPEAMLSQMGGEVGTE